MEESINPLVHFRRRWWRYLIGEGLLSAVAGAALGWGLSFWLPLLPVLGGILGALLSASVWYRLRQPTRVQLSNVADYLNRHNPTLQDSAELALASPEALSPLQRWQRSRIAQALQEAARVTPVPHQLRTLTLLLILALLLTTTLSLAPHYTPAPENKDESRGISIASNTIDAPLPAGVASWQIRLTSPAYMRLPERTQQTWPIEAWEGTQVRFQVAFTQPVQRAVLVWGQGDTLSLRGEDTEFRLARTLERNTFYALAWLSRQGEWQRSDYAPVAVRPDAPPEVSVTGREPYVKLDYVPGMKVDVPLEYSDDFDLTTSEVVATVARGQGESVKFRESRLPISHPWDLVRPTERLTLRLWMDSLEMTPGDELYFYVETFDNRAPERQRSRTEMYFVALRDTADNVVQMEGGLGVDLMPEYFRSQRQLIIDTEKLIADRKAGRITEQEFKSLSNELGYDQKALRLKYGALLGLEDEEASSVPAEVAPEATVDAYFQHEENEEFRDDSHEHGEMDHDHAEEEGSIFSRLVAEGFGSEDHDHGAESPNAEENPVEAYMHAHDDSEEATFYAEGLKAKLRYALDQMWDAELYLRIYTPAESLPYQREALEMINDIRLDSRIYVERVGFEPPPLKVAEVRLTGDQDEIQNVSQGRSLAEQERYPAFRAALPVLERIRTQPGPLSPAETSTLRLAGQSLAALALDQPGELLTALGWLKNLEEGTTSGPQQAAQAALVEATLWQLLPAPQPQVTARPRSLTALQKQWSQATKGGNP